MPVIQYWYMYKIWLYFIFFRYNDFFLMAEALHKFADDLQDIGSYLLYIFWAVDKYAPNPR